MEGLSAEPETKLLSEMEGFPYIWDEEKERFGIRLQRNRLPDYATVDFWEALQMWNDWQEFGFPEDGGTNNQGALWMVIVRTFEKCAQRIRAEK